MPDTDAPRIDWYERRNELRVGDVFVLTDGDLVRLDRRVPGDGTKWYADNWTNGSWGSWDYTIEPGDLVEKVADPQPFTTGATA
jgi:hypothetical protein